MVPIVTGTASNATFQVIGKLTVRVWEGRGREGGSMKAPQTPKNETVQRKWAEKHFPIVCLSAKNLSTLSCQGKLRLLF